MGYIQRLPFILGASMAIVIGVINDSSGAESKTVYIRMSVGLVAFFIIGLYIRGFIYKIDEELTKKRKEEQQREIELEMSKKKEESGQNVDYRVDDNIGKENDEKLYDEEFSPLEVNSINLNKED